PERAVITVRALASSTTHLELEIVDDGAGIDVGAVAKKSGREIADDHQLLEVLSAPGFSTRDVASTTSGRGVGLDIVRRTIETLGGALELANAPGHGVTWRMRVPLTVALVDAFACAAGDARWLVPVSAVEAIVELDDADRIETPTSDGGRGVGMLSTRGMLVPLVSLGEALGGAAREGDRKALLVQHGRQHFAFAVERMLGRHEVIVRPLVDPLVQSATVAGSADLGDGLPTLVLDLRAIAQRFGQVHA
ncbi:MAG TPA: chemotaxis protein CheW, partial [Nannocystaceae bacterium]|nr:chemotaxis protein CheW [Nannocystaceae bacterium]